MWDRYRSEVSKLQLYKRAGRPGGQHAIEAVCAFGCFRLRAVFYKSAFKGPQLEARASPVHTRPLFYEPHRSSGAGRSPCLQRSHLLPPSPPRRRLGPALKACARETYLLWHAGTQAAQAILTPPRNNSSPSKVFLRPCSQGPAPCWRPTRYRVGSTFRGALGKCFRGKCFRRYILLCSCSRCHSRPRRVRTPVKATVQMRVLEIRPAVRPVPLVGPLPRHRGALPVPNGTDALSPIDGARDGAPGPLAATHIPALCVTNLNQRLGTYRSAC